ncbi:MAG: hypothetical protein GY725_02705 [bacterium]|nr:hypothetical protein [bacterium]
MKRIGILNLTRFGDLVQTTPVLCGLRKRYPDAELHLIVKSRFRLVADMLPCVDAIHEIDGDELARALADPESSFVEAYEKITSVVDRLAEIEVDVMYNLTHSRASAVLLSLLEAKERVGYSIDREGLRHVENPWLAHMGTLVCARRLNRFNLVDMYLGAAGLLGCGERMSVRISSSAREFAEAILPHGPHYLAVQLGASSDTKTWSIERYAATLRALAQRLDGLQVVLVGVGSESDAAERLVSECPGVEFIWLIGQTEVAQLAAVIERCDLLLTGDTGTMHLAGAVGTKTCAVFVGLGTPWETGVYAEGNYALMSRIDCAPCQHDRQCGHPVCHTDIPTEWLAELIERLLLGKGIDELPAAPRADLFRTCFDEDGLLDLVPQHERAATPNDLMGLAWRALFLEHLARIPVDVNRIWRRAELRYGIAPWEWCSILPETINADLDRLEALGREAVKMASELSRLRESHPEISKIGSRLEQCDEAILEIARSEPLLAPAGLSLEGSLEGLPDGDLPLLSSMSSGYYQALVNEALALRKLFNAPKEQRSQGGPAQ